MSEDRLTAIEQDITKITKVVNQAYYRLNTLEQECKEIKDQEEAEQQQQVEQQPATIERADESEASDFTCSSCSVTKPIDQRERKGKQKSSVCKQCANIRLKERRKKSRDNGTSRYECGCGSTFQRWELTKHEQTIKHKTYIKSLGLEEQEDTPDLMLDSTEGLDTLDGQGVNDPLIVF